MNFSPRGSIGPNQHGRSLSKYPSLPDLDPIAKKKTLQIAIVSPEIMGPPHAGIGTAYHLLADALARDNNQVTILFAPHTPPPSSSFNIWKNFYSNLNIKLELLSPSIHPPLVSLWTNAKNSYHIMLWLLEQNSFDVVHFPDIKGLGYFSILLKHQGLAFHTTHFVVGAHGTTFWDASFSFGEKTYYQDFLERSFLEAECTRMTDVLVSPSHFHLEWMEKQQKWTLPSRTYVQPNIMNSAISLKEENFVTQEISKTVPVKEFVFFGRLERRKGIILFCDALDHPSLCGRTDFSVSFMGTDAYVDGKSAYAYLSQRSRNWNFSWTILPRKKREDALHYLKGHGRLALIPSLSETMSYTVLECIWAKIPFLASRVGGIPELIDQSDIGRVTFEPTPKSFSDALERALGEGVEPAKSSFNIRKNEKSWVDWHQCLRSSQYFIEQPQKNLVRISLCIVEDTLKNPLTLDFINSIESQSLGWDEAILIRMGKVNKEQNLDFNSESFNWIIRNQEEIDVPQAINAAAMESKGEILLFIDSSVILDKNAISIFLRVLEKTKSDLLTTAERLLPFDGNSVPFEQSVNPTFPIRIHLGNSLSLGVLHNVFGGSTFLVKSEVFKKLGGFSDQTNGKDPYWDFFSRAILEGNSLETIPLPQCTIINVNSQGIDSCLGTFDYLSPYLKDLPEKFHDLFHLIQATRFFHDPAPDGTFEDGFVNRPQAYVDRYWNSRIWKFYFPIENKIRKFLKQNPFEYPRVRTLTEALRVEHKIHQTLFWNISTPIKSALKIILNKIRFWKQNFKKY